MHFQITTSDEHFYVRAMKQTTMDSTHQVFNECLKLYAVLTIFQRGSQHEVILFYSSIRLTVLHLSRRRRLAPSLTKAVCGIELNHVGPICRTNQTISLPVLQ